jgi:hypothetical protein
MGKLRQRYDDLKERYANSDVTISVQSKQKTSSSISSILLPPFHKTCRLSGCIWTHFSV